MSRKERWPLTGAAAEFYDNPAQWHGRMSGLVFEALRCRDAYPPAARKEE
jgi:hypothetical protein